MVCNMLIVILTIWYMDVVMSNIKYSNLKSLIHICNELCKKNCKHLLTFPVDFTVRILIDMLIEEELNKSGNDNS